MLLDIRRVKYESKEGYVCASRDPVKWDIRPPHFLRRLFAVSFVASASAKEVRSRPLVYWFPKLIVRGISSRVTHPLGNKLYNLYS